MDTKELQRLMDNYKEQKLNGNHLISELLLEELCNQIVTNSKQQELRDVAINILNCLVS